MRKADIFKLPYPRFLGITCGQLGVCLLVLSDQSYPTCMSGSVSICKLCADNVLMGDGSLLRPWICVYVYMYVYMYSIV